MEVDFRGGQIVKIAKIRVLGQDGFPGTQNTQKSSKNEPPGLQKIKKIIEKTIPGNKDAARWRVTRAAH